MDYLLIALNSNNQAVDAVCYRMFDEPNKGYGYVDSNTPESIVTLAPHMR